MKKLCNQMHDFIILKFFSTLEDSKHPLKIFNFIFRSPNAFSTITRCLEKTLASSLVKGIWFVEFVVLIFGKPPKAGSPNKNSFWPSNLSTRFLVKEFLYTRASCHVPHWYAIDIILFYNRKYIQEWWKLFFLIIVWHKIILCFFDFYMCSISC